MGVEDLALDFSFTHPPVQAMVDVGTKVALAYTGGGKPRPSREYIEDMIAHGIGFCFIQQTTALRAFEGYSAGFVDAQYADARADEVGYPADCIIYYVFGDTSNTAAFVPQLREYARGIGDGTYRTRFGAYGARTSIDAAQQGSPKCVRRWGVRTWGFNGMAVPDADLIQEANIPAPLAATDYNSIWNPDLGQWGGGSPAPPSTSGANSMDIIHSVAPDGSALAFVRSGIHINKELAGPPITWLNDIPDNPDTNDWFNGGGSAGRGSLDTRKVPWQVMVDARTMHNNALLAPGGGGGGPADITTVPDAQFVAEAQARLMAGKIAITGSTITDA